MLSWGVAAPPILEGCVSEPSPVMPAEVTAIVEREFRFIPVYRLPRSVVTEPDWEGYTVTPLATEHQQNTYLDSPTQELARQGISFRRRMLDDRAELTLKLKRTAGNDHLFARPEYTEPIGADEPLAGHRLLTVAESFTADGPIAPWFTFCTRREGVALARSAAIIHLTWDRLTLPGDPTFVDEEIEAELVAGPVEELHALADLLTGTYGLQFGDDGKRTRVGHYLARRGRITFPGVLPSLALAQ
jgi:inorganic triphosphatase YgiF